MIKFKLNNTNGNHSGEDTPLTIPNREVKLTYANGTASLWKSRKLPKILTLLTFKF